MSFELRSVYASLPKVTRGFPKVIGGDPKGKNFLYTNGKCVIIRDIENPAIADVYTEHAHEVTVAKYAPSGFYIASADVTGKIHIWDTVNEDHLLKYQYTPISGEIRDLAWTEDSKRICVVGDGRQKFASVFLWDSGSSTGEISGHENRINTVDIRQKRPYRIVTGSEDFSSCFFQGPPFKFNCTLRQHCNFVHCVRYSPDGEMFATASADGKICIHHGVSGEFIQTFGGEKAHDGGVYAVSWSPDSTQLISASGDKTVKLWDVSAGTAVTTFNMGTDMTDQQLGCLWQKDHLLSFSLSGNINYLDKNNPDRPIRIVKGHTKSIQCLTVHKSDGQSYIYTGSTDGHINYWNAETGDNDCFTGKGHTNQVTKMMMDEDGELVTCSMDDTVRFSDARKKEYSASDTVAMDFQPKHLSVGKGKLSLAVCIGQICLLRAKKKVFTMDNLGYEPEVGLIHPGGTTAAVGSSDGSIHLYSIEGNTLKEGQTVDLNKARIMDMAYSNDGAYLAVIDEAKISTVLTVADGYTVKTKFYGHYAKPVTLAWSPDNDHFATAGMDMLVCVFGVCNGSVLKKKDPHRLHHVTGLAWLDDHTLVTTSHDACVKQWNVQC